MSTQPQHKLGRYELIREVARSNDIVYEGWDPITHRRVAVKVLNIPTGSSADQRADRKQRFDREARAAARLHHANVVTLFDYGTERDLDFLVFEFIDGSTLADLLLQTGPLPPAEAIKFARQILAALGYAHKQGIVHRDIKPSNIFVCSGDLLKIADLGIARIESEASVTTDGQIFGTPAYMSPEQVRGQDVDRRVDIWAAGAVLFQMSTGTQAFKGGSVLEIGSSVLNEQPNLDLITDPLIRGVVARALLKDPAQRFQSAQEMLAQFDAVPQAVVSPAVPAPVAVPALIAASPKRRRRARVAVIWVASCLAAAALGAGVVSLLGRHPVVSINPPKAPEAALNVPPKSPHEVYREAWEHTSLHDLATSNEFRLLPSGAQVDKIDTWCRLTIGKDYLALDPSERERLVADLLDEFRAASQIAALNTAPQVAIPMPTTKSAMMDPAMGGTAPGTASQQGVPKSTPLYDSPNEIPSLPQSAAQSSPAGSSVQSPPGQSSAPVADNSPQPGTRGYIYPEQQAHDLDDLEVLRKLHFTPDRPPEIAKGGVRVYSGPNGTVRIR